MTGALLLVVAVVGLAFFGGGVASVLGLASAFRVALAAYVVAWAALAALAALLSLPGVLGRGTLVAGTALLGAAGVSLARRGPTRPLASPRTAALEALRDPIVRVLAAGLAAVGLYVTVLALFTTPNDWDGLTYHETRALLWDREGGIGYVESGNDPRLDGNPPLAEIGLYLTMVVPRTERYAALPALAALAAAVLAVALLARRLGLARPAALYAALVFGSLPVVLLHGASILNDLPVASFLLAAVVFLLGATRAELALGAVAVGLALETKFTAVFALPLLAAVVIAGRPRDRRRPLLAALAAGVALGSPWYILNLAHTGSPDGDLGDTTGQATEYALVPIVTTLRALVFDVVDTSGYWRWEIVVPGIAGALLLACGVFLAARGGRARTASTLALGGLVVGLTPLALRGLEYPAREAWKRGWYRLGQEELSLAHGDAWKVLGIPDTSMSWYGAAGAVVVLAGPVLAFRAWRGERQRLARLLALAPLAFLAILALTVVYDPWRGRLVMFAVGLACAVWGSTLERRWLSTGMAALCLTTAALSCVHSFTKPIGFGLAEDAMANVWSRDRIDTLTVIRDYDGTPALLRAVEAEVPADAELAVSVPVDTFLAPLAGPTLGRTLRLVGDGRRVPPRASWLVVRDTVVARGCLTAWQAAYVDEEFGWRVLRRVSRDACADRTAPL